MSQPDFCRQCGTILKPGSAFCPRCGKDVTVILEPSQIQPLSTQSTQQQGSASAIWGIDKRFIIGAVILLVLIIPVIPRQRVVDLTETVTVTVTSMSTTFVTSYVTQVVGQGQTTIQVFVGHIRSRLMGTTTVDPQDHVIRVDYVNEAGGTLTVTLYTYEGQQRVFRRVWSHDLTLSGTATVQGSGQTIVTPVVTPSVTPIQSVEQQPQVRPQVITERVSILQILLGY